MFHSKNVLVFSQLWLHFSPHFSQLCVYIIASTNAIPINGNATAQAFSVRVSSFPEERTVAMILIQTKYPRPRLGLGSGKPPLNDDAEIIDLFLIL